MTVELHLNRDLSACPTCWQNFIIDFNNRYCLSSLPAQCQKHFDAVNQELRTVWKAHIPGKDWEEESLIIFASEQDKLWFSLRWS